MALLPFAAWADTGGVAVSTLTFGSVINTLIDDTWGNLSLTQAMIEDIASKVVAGGTAFPIAWGGSSPNIEVTVQALSAFEVYSSYVSDPVGATSFTHPNAVLWLDQHSGLGSFAGSYLLYSEVAGLASLAGSPGTNTGDHGLTLAEARALTSLSWTGTNNIASGGETRTYDVSWDPSQLIGDLSTNSTIDFRIYFVVTDPTT